MYKYYSFYEQNKYHNAIRILVFYNLGFEFKGRNVTKPWYSWKNLQTNSYDSNVIWEKLWRMEGWKSRMKSVVSGKPEIEKSQKMCLQMVKHLHIQAKHLQM